MSMTNPFRPTAGGEPTLLIGRDRIIRDFEKGLDNGVGAPGRIMLVTGARGLSRNDRAYLESMTRFDGPIPTAAVADRMGKGTNYASTHRRRLLDACMIRETERGEVDFAVPFLREYLRRG